MTVNKYLMPILAVVALLGTIFVTQLTGDWIVSGKDIPLGEMTPEDIKGWMTLENVADGLQIPLAEVYRLAGIPAGSDIPPTTAMKDLEGLIEGFETSVLREAAAAYLAGETGAAPAAAETPAPAATPTPQPTPAAAVVATPTHAPLGDGTGTGPTPLPAGQILPAVDIKGRMTLQEVASQTGVELAKLLAALGLPADTNPNTQVKTLVDEGKVAEVETIRAAVTELQK